MLAWVAYAIVAIVWGSTYYAIALGIEAFTPYGMVAGRYLLAGALALGLSRILKEPFPAWSDARHLMLQGALLLAVSNALVTWAEGSVASGVTAVLCSMSPLAGPTTTSERQAPRSRRERCSPPLGAWPSTTFRGPRARCSSAPPPDHPTAIQPRTYETR